ncbi:MAG: hypothetical protein ACRCXT_14720 [Paraclostridium sp.]
MSSLSNSLLINELDFLNFKQQVLFFKQPNHKATEFADLDINQFLDIRNLVDTFEDDITNGFNYNFKYFETELFKVCPSLKTYPSAAGLVARILMSRNIYDNLFSSNN